MGMDKVEQMFRDNLLRVRVANILLAETKADALISFRRRDNAMAILAEWESQLTTLLTQWGQPFGSGVVEGVSSPDDHPGKLTAKMVIAMTQAAHFVETSNGALSTLWPDGENPWHELATDLRRFAAALHTLFPPQQP